MRKQVRIHPRRDWDGPMSRFHAGPRPLAAAARPARQAAEGPREETPGACSGFEIRPSTGGRRRLRRERNDVRSIAPAGVFAGPSARGRASLEEGRRSRSARDRDPARPRPRATEGRPSASRAGTSSRPPRRGRARRSTARRRRAERTGTGRSAGGPPRSRGTGRARHVRGKRAVHRGQASRRESDAAPSPRTLSPEDGGEGIP